MAKQIEGVYESVLKYAKDEFLDKGFKDASLRDIARAADTSTGSIYTRFKDKEGLFQALVEPVAQEMKRIFLEVQVEFHELETAEQTDKMAEYCGSGMIQMLDYIFDHLDEFRLLLDSSHGTRFQNFVDELVDIEVEYTYKYMEAIGCETIRSGQVTGEFLHIVTNGYFNALFEVIRHDMTKDEARNYLKMLQEYHMRGFDSIFYPQNV